MKNIFAHGVSDNYLQRIDSATKMNGGFTFGLRISKTISDNLLIKSGLQYTQRNEQFASKSDSIITTTSVVTVRTIVRGSGLSDTTVRDTATVQQIGYRKRVTNNHYKSLEIPLLLSYENGNDKWHYAINGGIIANLTSWYQGETLDTSFQLVPLGAKNTNGFYKSNLNLSLYAGVSIIRNISNRLDIFAEPYFRYGISNTNTSTAGYSQRFNATGLTLGIRYKLNNKGSGVSN
jgi:opacity protein-like surface antigen